MLDMILRPGTKGFHLISPEGNVLSIQYGHNNYVDNTDMMNLSGDPVSETTCVELAMWDETGKKYRLTRCDDVKGYFPVSSLGILLMLFYADNVEAIIKLTNSI